MNEKPDQAASSDQDERQEGNRDDRYICEVCGSLFQNVEKRSGCWCELEEVGDNCEVCGAEFVPIPSLSGSMLCPIGCWKCGECGESFSRNDLCAECIRERQRGRLQ